MRRIIAFLIDHMILSMILVLAVFLVIFGCGAEIPREAFPAALMVCMIPWLGYFVIADHYFHGMTLGKKLMGLRMVWGEDDGPVKFSAAVVHTLLKWLLAAFYPIGLILYLVLGCRMPYDKRLGIAYTFGGKSGEKSGEKTSAWKIVVRVVCGITVFFAVAIAVVVLMLQKISSEEYYTVKTETVASVGTVLGKQRLTSYSESSSSDSVHKEYQYAVKGKAGELVKSYEEYLVQNEGFRTTDESEAMGGRRSVVLSKVSSDGKYEVTVRVISVSDRLAVVVDGKEYSVGQ